MPTSGGEDGSSAGKEPPGSGAAPRPRRRGLRLLPLIAVVYCVSAGGPFGIEEIIPKSGPGLTILLILLLPIFYGLPLGLAAGEMGSRFPVEGGYYRWSRHVFGDFWGFQAGWWSWIGGLLDGAAYAALVADYASPIVAQLLPSCGPACGPIAHRAICLLVIVACTWGNLRGIILVGWSSLAFAVFILSPFALFCGLGLLHWSHNPLVPLKPPDKGWLQALGAGTLIGMWSYSGYESLSTAAEELEDPRRNYMKAILIAIVVTVPTYLLPVLVGLANTGDWPGFEAGTFSEIGRAIGGAGLESWLATAGVISMLALFNGYTLAYSRIPFTMAQDGYLPRALARTHSKHGTPWVALLAGACIYTALTSFSVADLLVMEMWMFSALYIMIYLALWRVRCRPELDRGAREGDYRFIIPAGRRGIWWVILPPMLLIAGAVFASVMEDIHYLFYGGLGLLSGPLIYPVVAWFRNRRAGPAGPGTPASA
jgi:amino acid transporter